MCIWFKSADVKAALPSNFTLDVNEEQAVFVKVIDFPKKLVAQKVPFFCEAKLVVAFGPKEIQRSHEPPPPKTWETQQLEVLEDVFSFVNQVIFRFQPLVFGNIQRWGLAYPRI